MRATESGCQINILGKDYVVACPEDKREELMSAAAYLDKNMREIQQSGAVLGTELDSQNPRRIPTTGQANHFAGEVGC